MTPAAAQCPRSSRALPAPACRRPSPLRLEPPPLTDAPRRPPAPRATRGPRARAGKAPSRPSPRACRGGAPASPEARRRKLDGTPFPRGVRRRNKPGCRGPRRAWTATTGGKRPSRRQPGTAAMRANSRSAPLRRRQSRQRSGSDERHARATGPGTVLESCAIAQAQTARSLQTVQCSGPRSRAAQGKTRRAPTQAAADPKSWTRAPSAKSPAGTAPPRNRGRAAARFRGRAGRPGAPRRRRRRRRHEARLNRGRRDRSRHPRLGTPRPPPLPEPERLAGPRGAPRRSGPPDSSRRNWPGSVRALRRLRGRHALRSSRRIPPKE